jgi:putative intracellular protease/amidase
MAISGKKVLMVIPPENFRDEEFEEVYGVLKQLGATITIGSATLSEATGMMGKRIRPDAELDGINGRNFDAVVFIGGTGVRQYFTYHRVMDIAQQAFLHGRIVAAISFAPSLLANAGILENRSSTSSLTEQGNLIMHGAKYTGRDLEVAGNVITAKDSKCAQMFAQAIAHQLFNQ